MSWNHCADMLLVSRITLRQRVGITTMTEISNLELDAVDSKEFHVMFFIVTHGGMNEYSRICMCRVTMVQIQS